MRTVLQVDAQIECAEADPEIFFAFPGERVKILLAKSYCKRCPVTQECLQGAYQIHDEHSIRGGLTAAERRALVRSQRSAALG